MFPVLFTFFSFLRDCKGNKVTHLFSVIPAIVHYGEVFCHNFNLNEFIYEYVVNIRFICDSTRYLISYLWVKEKTQEYDVQWGGEKICHNLKFLLSSWIRLATDSIFSPSRWFVGKMDLIRRVLPGDFQRYSFINWSKYH